MSDHIEKRFDYVAPNDTRLPLHTLMREATKGVAYDYDEVPGESREKSLALTKLEEALMWINAHIARNVE